MSVTDIRRISTGLMVAAILAGVQTMHAQRPAESAASARSAPGARPADGPAIVPFKIQVPNAVLTDLKQRLTNARFADEFPDANWDYGMNLAYLKTLVDYWRDKYDWRAQEKKLNQFDQFKTTIDGVDIYFIHQKS